VLEIGGEGHVGLAGDDDRAGLAIGRVDELDVGAVVVDVVGGDRLAVVGDARDAVDRDVSKEEGAGPAVEGLDNVRAAPVPLPVAVGLGVGLEGRDDVGELGLFLGGQGDVEEGGDVGVGDVGHTAGSYAPIANRLYKSTLDVQKEA